MTSAVSAPLRIENSYLKMGEMTPSIPLKTATSFQINPDGGASHEIRVFCHTKQYQTTLCLHLATQERVAACAQTLLQNNIQAEVVCVSSAKVEKTEDSIALNLCFINPSAREEFLTYAMPELPELKSSLSEHERRLTLTLKGDTKEVREKKIQEIFARIACRFGYGGIGLVNLLDPQFPTPDPFLEKPIKQSRTFTMSEKGIYEEIPYGFRLSKTAEDIVAWMENPEPLCASVLKEYKDILKTEFEIAIETEEFDESSLKSLLKAVKMFPPEDATELLSAAIIQILKQSDKDKNRRLSCCVVAALTLPGFDLVKVVSQAKVG